MGQAIEHIRVRLDNETSHDQFIVSRELLAEMIAEADLLDTLKQRAFRQSGDLACHNAALEQQVSGLQRTNGGLNMQVQVLQMTQGALKMEIDRLREAAAVKVYAADAVVTFGCDGTVTLQAPLVEMHGDMTVTA